MDECISTVYVGARMADSKKEKLLSVLQKNEIKHREMLIDGYFVTFENPEEGDGN
jgi:hypothetical protein